MYMCLAIRLGLRSDGWCFFFFFQAEDGIRDLIVTGVQTCALPISRSAEEVRTRVRQTQGQIGRVVEAMQQGREAAQGVGSVATTVQGALDAIFSDLNTDRKSVV